MDMLLQQTAESYFLVQ